MSISHETILNIGVALAGVFITPPLAYFLAKKKSQAEIDLLKVNAQKAKTEFTVAAQVDLVGASGVVIAQLRELIKELNHQVAERDERLRVIEDKIIELEKEKLKLKALVHENANLKLEVAKLTERLRIHENGSG